MFGYAICLQVVDYYKEACRALENSETASMLGKIQKDWKNLVQMKILLLCCNCSCESSIQTEVGLTTEQAFYDLDFF